MWPSDNMNDGYFNESDLKPVTYTVLTKELIESTMSPLLFKILNHKPKLRVSFLCDIFNRQLLYHTIRDKFPYTVLAPVTSIDRNMEGVMINEEFTLYVETFKTANNLHVTYLHVQQIRIENADSKGFDIIYVGNEEDELY